MRNVTEKMERLGGQMITIETNLKIQGPISRESLTQFQVGFFEIRKEIAKIESADLRKSFDEFLNRAALILSSARAQCLKSESMEAQLSGINEDFEHFTASNKGTSNPIASDKGQFEKTWKTLVGRLVSELKELSDDAALADELDEVVEFFDGVWLKLELFFLELKSKNLNDKSFPQKQKVVDLLTSSQRYVRQQLDRKCDDNTWTFEDLNDLKIILRKLIENVS